MQSCSNVCYLRGSDSEFNVEFSSSDGMNEKYIILLSRKNLEIKRRDAILQIEARATVFLLQRCVCMLRKYDPVCLLMSKKKQQGERRS